MFEGATPVVFEYAKNLRKTMTSAEMVLWGNLKKGINGYKYRRQHPIGNYIADFYCHRLKLVIEVDGSIHGKSENKLLDQKRESDLQELGYSTIRFTNEDILKNMQLVLDKIYAIVETDLKKQTNNKK